MRRKIQIGAFSNQQSVDPADRVIISPSKIKMKPDTMKKVRDAPLRKMEEEEIEVENRMTKLKIAFMEKREFENERIQQEIAKRLTEKELDQVN